jgi:hypothetical protein
MKKLSTTKFYNFLGSTNFVFGHFVICLSDIYETIRDVNFVNDVTTTLSDEEMTKIKVVDFDEFYNFYVHDFSS